MSIVGSAALGALVAATVLSGAQTRLEPADNRCENTEVFRRFHGSTRVSGSLTAKPGIGQ